MLVYDVLIRRPMVTSFVTIPMVGVWVGAGGDGCRSTVLILKRAVYSRLIFQSMP